jgi:hypothetical protein
MPQTFDRSVLSSRSGINLTEDRPECEAYGCDKKATKQITIDAGGLGHIDLNVCKSCLPKFNDNDEDKVVPGKDGVRYRSLPSNGVMTKYNVYRVSTA